MISLSQEFWDIWLSMDLGSKVMEGYILWSRQANQNSFLVVQKCLLFFIENGSTEYKSKNRTNAFPVYWYIVISPASFDYENILKSSVVDPNTLNLDPDPGFWPNLYPDPKFKKKFPLKEVFFKQL